MPLGVLRPSVLVVAALLTATALSILPVDGGNAVDATTPLNTEARPGGQPLLKFRVGDRYSYVNETYGARVDLAVLPPVMAAAANLTKVLALPMLTSVTYQGIEVREADLMDLATGDLVASPDACLVDVALPCSGQSAGVRWGCPLDGVFGVADYVTRDDLEHSAIVLQDPVVGWRFTYGVERLEGAVRFVLKDAGKIACAQRPAVTIDLDLGIVTAMTVRPHVGGVNLTLADWVPGDGPVLQFTGAPSRASIFLPPETPRRSIYPPGYGEVGPVRWTLGEAVGRAQTAGDGQFGRWLEGHPDAFVYENNLARSWSESLGVLRTETFRWTLDVLSPEREMVRLVAEKEIIQDLVEVVRFNTSEVAIPDVIPPRIRPPSETGVLVKHFVQAMAEREYYPDLKERVNPLLETGFDEDGGGAFSYFFIIGSAEVAPDSSLLLGFLLVNDTGRLGGATLPLERARELVG